MTLQEEILQEFVEAGATRHDWSAMYDQCLLQVVLDDRERAREWYLFNKHYKCRWMRKYRIRTIEHRREYERTPARVAAKKAYDKKNNDRPGIKACKRRYYEKRRDAERAKRLAERKDSGLAMPCMFCGRDIGSSLCRPVSCNGVEAKFTLRCGKCRKNHTVVLTFATAHCALRKGKSERKEP